MADENVRASDPRNLLVVERASLWLREYGSTDAADWREVGSIVNVRMDPQDTRLAHFSNRRGARVKDREIITERTLGVDFDLEEMNLHNLQYAFGDAEDPSAGVKDMKESFIRRNPGATLTIDLGHTDIKNVIVRSTALDGAEVTYVEGGGNDYTVDLPSGVITILAGGDLEDETTVPEVHIFFEKELTSQNFRLFPGQEIEVEAQFQILGNGGAKQIYSFEKATLKVAGALQFGNGDSFQSVPMRLEVLADAEGELGEGALIDEGEVD